MSFKKIFVYTKVVLIAILLLAVLVFLVQNRQPVTIKFFGWTILDGKPLFAYTFLMLSLGAILSRVGSRARKIINDFKQMKKEENQKQRLQDEIRKQVQAENGAVDKTEQQESNK
ncbi:MAG: hypothetical protein JEZ07_16070 [Phycisphaerae bacterium]|nr:hypothetical protein [Phycisphaerae bacterium]